MVCIYIEQFTVPIVRGYLGFSILPKDTSACGMGETGMKPQSHWLVEDPLYLLSRIRYYEKEHL